LCLANALVDKKLSCRRKTAQRFVSLNIPLSPKAIGNSTIR